MADWVDTNRNDIKDSTDVNDTFVGLGDNEFIGKGGDDILLGKTKKFSISSSVLLGANNHYGGFSVVPGTKLTVNMYAGFGDADLYVNFNSPATLSEFVCRPFVNGNSENCTLTVPKNVQTFYIMVDGYSNASYNIDLIWVSQL